MKAISAAIAFLLGSSAFSADLIGAVVPPYPAGLESKQGTCIGGSQGKGSVCAYGLAVIDDSNGKPIFIVAEKNQSDASEHPSWLITDAIPYPEVQHGYYLAMGICQVNQKPDEAVVAVVRVVEAEWLTGVVWARRVEIGGGRFASVSTNNIRCANEGWGAE